MWSLGHNESFLAKVGLASHAGETNKGGAPVTKELMRPSPPNFACTVRKSLVIPSKESQIPLCCENLLFEEGFQPPLLLY